MPKNWLDNYKKHNEKEENKSIFRNPDGAGPLFEDEDVDFDCEEAWGWNHANPGYFRE